MRFLVYFPFLPQLLQHTLGKRFALLVMGREALGIIPGKFVSLCLLEVGRRRNPGPVEGGREGGREGGKASGE